ncbi:hypothetical protein IC620_11115 [Hazenella sp. IB182357]|uniref:Uncharacterized protein n=1 Tax=Polycladospora coralii TaxID=2771432 RepID=A0A926N9X5_9BACL|nr:hypothetical protein [Polycladospora coralii]MBD1372906.1 hypothetical protein [Polycladospora coralii]
MGYYVFTTFLNYTFRYITELKTLVPLAAVKFKVSVNESMMPETPVAVLNQTAVSYLNAWQGKFLVQQGVSIPPALNIFPIYRVNYSPNLIYTAQALYRDFFYLFSSPSIGAQLISVETVHNQNQSYTYSP